MFSFFKKKNTPPAHSGIVPDFSFLGTDMHSHMVPGIDDGSQALEDSIAFIKGLYAVGIRNFITTPHIHREIYDNDTQKVQHHFQPLKDHLAQHMPDVSIAVSAEYFLDSFFLSEVLPHGLMPFGAGNVLVEVSMAGWPRNFNEIIFAIQANGYKPILAHPERYLYESNMAVYEELKNRGVLLQMNLLSITGYYGRTVQANAQLMLQNKLYDLCGTDLHHERHLSKIVQMTDTHPEIMHQLNEYGFKNRELYS